MVLSDRERLAHAALCAAGVALYLPILSGRVLAWDDPVWLDDPLLDLPLPAALTEAFTTTRQGAWYPLLRMSWWLQEATVGLAPGIGHAVNLALFVGGVALTLGVLRALAVPLPARLLAVALWIAHPSRVESVAWLTSRKDLLSYALAVFALRLALSERAGWAALVFLTAGLTKSAIAPFAGITVLILATRGWTDASRRAAIGQGVVGLGILIVGALVHRGSGIGEIPASGLDWLGFVGWMQTEWWVRLLDLGGSVAVVPVPDRWRDPAHLVGPAMLGVAGLAAWRAGPWARVLWAAWVLMLAPVHGFAPMAHWAADRHLLVPSLAVALAASIKLAGAGRSGLALGWVAVAACAWASAARIPAWRDDIALWEADLRAPGEDYVRHFQLGTAYGVAGRFAESSAQLRQAEHLRPGDPIPVARRLIADLAVDGWSRDDARLARLLQPPPADARAWDRVARALREAGQPSLAADAERFGAGGNRP